MYSGNEKLDLKGSVLNAAVLANQLIEAVCAVRRPVAVCLDDEAAGGCIDAHAEDRGRVRRMEEKKRDQERERKFHAIQGIAGSTRGSGA